MFDEAQLRRVLKNFASCYNQIRTYGLRFDDVAFVYITILCSKAPVHDDRNYRRPIPKRNQQSDKSSPCKSTAKRSTANSKSPSRQSRRRRTRPTEPTRPRRPGRLQLLAYAGDFRPARRALKHAIVVASAWHAARGCRSDDGRVNIWLRLSPASGGPDRSLKE